MALKSQMLGMHALVTPKTCMPPCGPHPCRPGDVCHCAGLGLRLPGAPPRGAGGGGGRGGGAGGRAAPAGGGCRAAAVGGGCGARGDEVGGVRLLLALGVAVFGVGSGGWQLIVGRDVWAVAGCCTALAMPGQPCAFCRPACLLRLNSRLRRRDPPAAGCRRLPTWWGGARRRPPTWEGTTCREVSTGILFHCAGTTLLPGVGGGGGGGGMGA